jgi:signal transduction histidine kinase
MRSAVVNNDKDETLHSLESLDRVAGHILQMVNQIKERTDEIVLYEQEHRLSELLEFTLQTLEPMLEDKRIRVAIDVQIDPIVLCDAAHIREVLSNLLINAMDAIEAGNGELAISILKAKKDVLLWVKDNGAGLSAESAARMFDPFFTTKKGSSNYGLGLNYCYGVMQKHGGSIRMVESIPGKGTWMELRFPPKRLRMGTAAGRSTGMLVGVY